MNTFLTFAPIVAGAYTLVSVHMIDVNNKMSALVLKGIPTLLGACSIIAGMKIGGII